MTGALYMRGCCRWLLFSKERPHLDSCVHRRCKHRVPCNTNAEVFGEYHAETSAEAVAVGESCRCSASSPVMALLCNLGPWLQQSLPAGPSLFSNDCCVGLCRLRSALAWPPPDGVGAQRVQGRLPLEPALAVPAAAAAAPRGAAPHPHVALLLRLTRLTALLR